ncbi:hypothetical protein [Cellulosimicrobium sp. I38E]|uniref:hypothetical protein n=1 Tax=Cellulosimicrobium sp. I38E TaxID=1393139 RepID=UPI0007B3070B|nr:hypothetical protein [Cellulosimicrobium sp. I38E]KZM78374.1 hypothetical protein A0J59_13660 [Cellulosimicrobium sp. I38E]
MSAASGWETLPAAYVASCAPDFIGERVIVARPAAGRRPAESFEGVLSDVVVLMPGSYPDPLPAPDGSTAVLTVRSPVVQLFVGGDVVFVAPIQPMHVQAAPTTVRPRREHPTP